MPNVISNESVSLAEWQNCAIPCSVHTKLVLSGWLRIWYLFFFFCWKIERKQHNSQFMDLPYEILCLFVSCMEFKYNEKLNREIKNQLWGLGCKLYKTLVSHLVCENWLHSCIKPITSYLLRLLTINFTVDRNDRVIR